MRSRVRPRRSASTSSVSRGRAARSDGSTSRSRSFNSSRPCSSRRSTSLNSVRLIGSLEPSSATLSSTDSGLPSAGWRRWARPAGRLLGEAQQFGDLLHRAAHCSGHPRRAPAARRRPRAGILRFGARRALSTWFSSRTTCTGSRTRRAWCAMAPLDALADPPRGVGREAEAALRLELADRVHQAEVAFLDEGRASAGRGRDSSSRCSPPAAGCARSSPGARRSRLAARVILEFFLRRRQRCAADLALNRSAACCRSRSRRRRVRGVVRQVRPRRRRQGR